MVITLACIENTTSQSVMCDVEKNNTQEKSFGMIDRAFKLWNYLTKHNTVLRADSRFDFSLGSCNLL